MITLALSKGRVLESTLPLLKKIGIEMLDYSKESRKLIFSTNNPQLQIIVIRSSDVPTYVKYGAADFGIVGYDVLLEYGLDNLYIPVNLNIAKCLIGVAAIKNFNYDLAIKDGRITVATKYAKITQEYFTNKGVHVDIINLHGAMELAPLVGLSDVIVDLVSTGNTLSANNLELIEKICDISSRLIVNKTSYKTKPLLVQQFIQSFQNL